MYGSYFGPRYFGDRYWPDGDTAGSGGGGTGTYFGARYFGARYFGPGYWGEGGEGEVEPPVGSGDYFGNRYFANAYFGHYYFGPGAEVETEETIRGHRRRRHPIRHWESVLARVPEPTADAIAKERALVAEMLNAADLEELIEERKILRAALDQAKAQHEQSLNLIIERVTRRIDDIVEDDEITFLLT